MNPTARYRHTWHRYVEKPMQSAIILSLFKPPHPHIGKEGGGLLKNQSKSNLNKIKERLFLYKKSIRQAEKMLLIYTTSGIK